MQGSIQQTVDHFFRHESGKMIAVLSRLLGLQHLQAAQDIAQDTLLQALQTWRINGLPDQPKAWLYRVAKNKAIDFLRREKTCRRVESAQAYLLQSEFALYNTITHLFEEEAITDSQLRMIFACCHPSIPVESQIALALKTLCGLSAGEIAKAFLKDEETIAKRIYRAKEKIRTENIALDLPSPDQLPGRLDAVLHCLYLLFNEGYNSSHPEQLIREDLCEEAMRLTYLLTQIPLTNLPRTNALLALFCFQASRLKARLDEGGNIILLKQQDRSKWYRPLIQKGFLFLEAATQEELSVYHLEAAIAYLHAVAPSFEETDWKAIYYLYQVLADQHPDAFVFLNKAIAASYAISKEEGLKQLEAISGLEKYYLYHTAIGEIYFELRQPAIARQHFEKALSLTRSAAEQQLLQEKIRACADNPSAFSLS
ncbi:MAG TPA: sigma-70 family RNA polymerase sigma factor [Flavisolibacter sp.]|jgi:RNA polymerase sigma-70 factor (ECF subfamily)|nr:sigma-70 family RNA polymerase sigma factor [Flavisolibacter sp.]